VGKCVRWEEEDWCKLRVIMMSVALGSTERVV
jgi:hypothetical protein